MPESVTLEDWRKVKALLAILDKLDPAPPAGSVLTADGAGGWLWKRPAPPSAG